MKVLVIGSGGREHAMVWKLLQSEKVERVYAAPGNGGTDDYSLPYEEDLDSEEFFDEDADEEYEEEIKACENVDLLGRDPSEEEVQDALIRYVKQERIDLTVVGPEAPLASGIADRFRAAGCPVAGPGAKEARLESSKAFAKTFMEKYGVRTARSYTFTSAEETLDASRRHFGAGGGTIVLKADGLAAGKGVVIAETKKEADETILSFMQDGALGGAGKTLVVEEFLRGREVSVLAAVCVTGGKGVILPFVSARDHKRRFDGDQGPNTGGMGAIAPVPDFNAAQQNDFLQSILKPTLEGMKAEGFDYRGFIFFGLLIQDGLCYLLEYNVRLGDPETQAVLPLMRTDFAELCAAIADGSLARENSAAANIAWKHGAVCAPVAVASGYPGEYRKGDPIAFNETAFAKTGAVFFAAGAKRSPGGPAGSGLRTAGGRVFAVSAYGSDAVIARDKAYAALNAVNFNGMAYRRDIGAT